MSKDIPHVTFKTGYPDISGIEIIRLEDLAKNQDSLTHNPEKPHQLKFNFIAFYLEGTTKHLIDFNWYNIEANTAVYVSKGQVNAFKFDKSVKGFMILFTEEYLETQLSYLPEITALRLFTSHLFSPKINILTEENIDTYLNLFYKEFYKTKEGTYKKALLNNLFNCIFYKIEALKSAQTLQSEKIEKLRYFLKFKSHLERAYTKNRNADYYAGFLNISYKHLNSISKEITKITAKQFIDDFVILEAKRYLVNSEIKSTELSYLLGFEEPTNFTKYFKKHTGITPSNFKKHYF